MRQNRLITSVCAFVLSSSTFDGCLAAAPNAQSGVRIEDGAVTSVPVTSVPVTSVPVTSVPATSVPTTSVPATSVPTTSVPVMSWIDGAAPVHAVLFCIHGLGLHKGTFSQFGELMAKHGVPTFAIDVRGFGEWREAKNRKIDFDGALDDIKQQLFALKLQFPNKPIFMLGESMGGAIALRATAMYPDLVDGLVSSVPAGDRFHQTSASLDVGLHAIMGGLNKPMKLRKVVVNRVTENDDLKNSWQSDPLARMDLTPRELMEFDSFMQKNFIFARNIKTKPVLFVQGANDKLVRPAGTWQLFESLGTPRRELVISKTAEHLIVEEGQFSKEDLSFIQNWIDKNAAPQNIAVTNAEPTSAVIASTIAASNAAAASNPSAEPSEAVGLEKNALRVDPATTAAAAKPTQPAECQASARAQPFVGTKTDTTQSITQKLSYWIELSRDGKVFRCNNKNTFKSGDSIRFHVIPNQSGFVYLMMKQGTTGRKATLFPTSTTGVENFLHKGVDYAIPTKAGLKFDSNPGTETLTLFFSRTAIAHLEVAKHNQIAYVSSERSGSKDLVPTRMRLTWDDPDPMIIPSSYSGASPSSLPSTSLVQVSSADPSVVLDIALSHQ